MTDLSAVAKIRVSNDLVSKAQETLRQIGKTGREGMVLWIGRQNDREFLVTSIVVPRQRGIRTQDGVCVIVDGDELHRINMQLFETRQRLIAQVHTHPTAAYHSETDDEFAIATTVGCISIVIPDFAEAMFSLRTCAIYRLTSGGTWHELSERDKLELIEITDP